MLNYDEIILTIWKYIEYMFVMTVNAHSQIMSFHFMSFDILHSVLRKPFRLSDAFVRQ